MTLPRKEIALGMLELKCGKLKILFDSVILTDEDLEYYIVQSLFYARNPEVNIYDPLEDVIIKEGVKKITKEEHKKIIELIKDKSKMEAIEVVEKAFGVKFRT